MCNICRNILCQKCWKRQLVHRKNADHEMTDPEIVRKIDTIIGEDLSTEDRVIQHRESTYSKWFGILHYGGSGNRTLSDFGRYSQLMAESIYEPSSEQYPSLVSFVGPTGERNPPCAYL